MAPHSSTLAWKIPWMEEPGRLQSMGSLRIVHNWATSLSLFTFMRWRRKWQPTPVILPGDSQGRGSLVGCRLWGPTELDTTEATWQHFCILHGNTLWFKFFPTVGRHMIFVTSAYCPEFRVSTKSLYLLIYYDNFSIYSILPIQNQKMNWFHKVAGYKINIQRSAVFCYMNNEYQKGNVKLSLLKSY